MPWTKLEGPPDIYAGEFEQLEAMPGMGRRYETDNARLQDLRVWPVKGFPNHLIFYRATPNGIEVVHVLHGARDLDSALGEEFEQ